MVGSSAFVACSGDNGVSGDNGDSGTAQDSGTTTQDSGTHDSGTVDSGPPPAAPTLGTVQIDRMGRAAINTALNHAFDADAGAAGAAKDAYNADTNISSWPLTYATEFAGNLAILDALDTGLNDLTDGGVGGCGNQPFFSATTGYAGLGAVLGDDRIYLNSAGATCTQYLAVELAAEGVGGTLFSTDCGGRGLGYDTIQTTYSVAAGVGLSGFGSGVTQPDNKKGTATFPYFATPL
jgi:hypothetical protein